MKKIKYLAIFITILILGIATFLMLRKGKESTPAVKTVPEKATNILVITLDTTRADKIGIYGCEDVKTPHLDALAKQGVRFENAYSPAPLTLPAHCSLFTGTYPLYHKVRNNGTYFLPEQIDTMAEILKRNGYTTAAFVSSFIVDSRFGLDQGFDVYNDNLKVEKKVKVYHSERTAESVFKDFAQWFSENSGKKFFCWVHFFDPHLPYAPPEPYMSEYRHDPYLGEIAYMDAYVGKISELLKNHKVFENTLIVIVGDHGEAFGEHKEYGHQIFCYEENLKIPFIINAKDSIPENIVRSEKVTLLDILPTVLDSLQFTIPDEIQGSSLLPLIRGESFPQRDIYIESIFAKEALGCAPVKGVIQKKYKYFDLPQPELYDLTKDPLEKNNLISRRAHVGKQLKKRVQELSEIFDTLEFNSQRIMTEEEKSRLASLGYITLTSQTNPDKALPDPKEGVAGYNEFSAGMQANSLNDYAGAEKHFKNAIAITPYYTAPYSMLAAQYIKNGRSEEAVQIFKKGIENNPRDNTIKLEYARTLIQLKQLQEARALLEHLEKLNPPDSIVQIQLYLGGIHSAQGKLTEAAISYQKALKTEPDNLFIKKQLAYTLHLSNRFTETLPLYVELEKSNPGDLGLIQDMAILYAQLNRLDKAEVYFEKLMKHNPRNNIYYNYALLLGKKGNYSKAIATMEKFLSMYSNEDGKKMFARQSIEKWKNLK
ncbi:MAG: tetratricopeptide repeat protein [Candidatus Aminicenantes bacterium]|nr:tetratricopeptide repeat protein [Candidatus Aminicenantes bacterium]